MIELPYHFSIARRQWNFERRIKWLGLGVILLLLSSRTADSIVTAKQSDNTSAGINISGEAKAFSQITGRSNDMRRVSRRLPRERMLHFNPDFHHEFGNQILENAHYEENWPTPQLPSSPEDSDAETKSSTISNKENDTKDSVPHQIQLPPTFPDLRNSFLPNSKSTLGTNPSKGEDPLMPIIESSQSGFELGSNRKIEESQVKHFLRKDEEASKNLGYINRDTAFTVVKKESISTNKTKDCKEPAFDLTPSTRSSNSSSGLEVNGGEGSPKVGSGTGGTHDVFHFQTSPNFAHADPALSPYSSALFKSSRENVLKLRSMDFPQLLAILGFFLLSFLGIIISFLSQENEMYFDRPRTKLVDPVQSSWERSFNGRLDYQNPQIQLPAHILLRPPKPSLRPPLPPFPFYWK